MEVGGQGLAIDLWAASRLAHSLRDIEDDAREAIFIKVDFLVVWDLPNCAIASLVLLGMIERARLLMYLTSAKLEGRSTIIAPPKRGVLLNELIISTGRYVLSFKF